MDFTASNHAGDRSFERNIGKPLVDHVLAHGIVTKQANGNLHHEARDPKQPDHVIEVVTDHKRAMIVTAIRDVSRPLSGLLQVQQHSKEKETQEKQTKDRSKANQKAQLKAKQERSRKAREAYSRLD